MQIRRIYDLDGGNHVQCDYLEYREGTGHKWKRIERVDSYDAMVADIAEGIEDYPKGEQWNMQRLKEAVDAHRRNAKD